MGVVMLGIVMLMVHRTRLLDRSTVASSLPLAHGTAAEGLRTRGFPVLNMLTAQHVPSEPSHSNVSVAVWGEVVEFWVDTHVEYGPWVARGEDYAVVTVRVKVYQVPEGRRTWEKTYSKRASSFNQRMSLGKALADVVKEAMYDADFVRELTLHREQSAAGKVDRPILKSRPQERGSDDYGQIRSSGSVPTR